MIIKILSALVILIPVGILGFLVVSGIVDYWPAQEEEEEDFNRRNEL